ncbi:MAG TPA: cytochrome c oxidase subunit II transmembrane domain-containing protein, partial [Casimicrobiaceae bacterium]
MAERTKTGAAARALLTASIAVAFALPGLAWALPEWNFQPPVTPIAEQIIWLHDFIFWICVVIFIGVFGVMFYSLFKHRKSVG